MSERQTTGEFKNYRTNNSNNIENALKCLKLDMLDNTQIELLLNYIDKLQKENQDYKKLILGIKGKLNNIQFEVEQSWRKIEKLESKYE